MTSEIKRTYLITGAGRRIGRAVALRAARENAGRIVLHYHTSQQQVKEVADEIKKMGVEVFLISADLGNKDQTQNLLYEAWDAAGPIDVLINNASIFSQNQIADSSMEDFHRDMMVNAFAPFFISKAFFDRHKNETSNKLPVIINFLDSRITDYDREHFTYHLAKRMLFTFTRITALEFAPFVRVNAIAPGLILPPSGKDETYLEQLKNTNPLNRIGNLEQITDAVQFLVCNEFITGQVIYVDGGRNLKNNIYG